MSCWLEVPIPVDIPQTVTSERFSLASAPIEDDNAVVSCGYFFPQQLSLLLEVEGYVLW